MRAEVSSGRSVFDSSSPTKLETPGSAAPAAVSIAAAPPVAGGLEGRGAHRDHLLGVLGAHGLHGIAGIDQALEGVGRDHLDDVGNLHDVEQRGDPRHEVLGVGGRRRDDRVVARRQRDDERRRRLGEHVLVSAAFGDQHLADARRAWRRLRRPGGSPCRRREHRPARPSPSRRSAPWRSRP